MRKSWRGRRRTQCKLMCHDWNRKTPFNINIGNGGKSIMILYNINTYIYICMKRMRANAAARNGKSNRKPIYPLLIANYYD